MRVGILGSWKPEFKEWAFESSLDQFKRACRELGRELERHRQLVIVGGHSERTADANVVQGVLEVAKGRAPLECSIEVIRPKRNNDSYRELASENDGLFGFHDPPHESWTEIHLLTVWQSDCILAIGGCDGTYRAGLAALVAKKPIIPIASFGGAAAHLLRDAEAFGQLLDKRDRLALGNPWGSTVLKTALRIAGIGRRPRVMLIHGHSADRYELEAWLRRDGELCDVRVMREEFAPGHLLPQKLEELAAWADGAIALVTPDDVGGAVGQAPTGRARENVWIEVGWFWGRLGRHRTLLLRKGDVDLPSDLTGVEYCPYSNVPSEKANEISEFLKRLRSLIERAA
jgi:predicted nucleotide-binding protein with TIR-like domain